jgi:membrane fusion protein, multidrug efflux system
MADRLTRSSCRAQTIPPPCSAAGLATLLLVTALIGCGEPETSGPSAETVHPALIHTVDAASDTAKLRFPGRVRAARRAELSFDVPGFVTALPIDEGTPLAVGQVVARLDDEVFRARLNAAKAEFERARTDLERYQRLWETEQAVARSEVDDRRSRLETARTNLAAAEQDLADTVIKTPFAGVLTRRRVEPFSNVQAKQPIADLQDLDTLEVVINVPERVLHSARPRQRGWAILEGEKPHRLPLRLKSYAAEADPQTQSYQIVLTVESVPADLTLLPGMSVTVLPFAEDDAPEGAIPAVPLTAITRDAKGGLYVWVVVEDGRVARRSVAAGEIYGGNMTIRSGLASGERIVAAGVSGLREGMKVRPLEAR